MFSSRSGIIVVFFLPIYDAFLLMPAVMVLFSHLHKQALLALFSSVLLRSNLLSSNLRCFSSLYIAAEIRMSCYRHRVVPVLCCFSDVNSHITWVYVADFRIPCPPSGWVLPPPPSSRPSFIAPRIKAQTHGTHFHTLHAAKFFRRPPVFCHSCPCTTQPTTSPIFSTNAPARVCTRA